MQIIPFYPNLYENSYEKSDILSHISNHASDFRHKEVINITTGERLGFIADVDIDLDKGIVNSVIVPGKRRFFGFLPPEEDIAIPWKNIRKIGEDIILVISEE